MQVLWPTSEAPAAAGSKTCTSASDVLSFLVIGDYGRQDFYNTSALASSMAVIASGLNASFVVSTGDNGA